jgi:hypothetical protein
MSDYHLWHLIIPYWIRPTTSMQFPTFRYDLVPDTQDGFWTFQVASQAMQH